MKLLPEAKLVFKGVIFSVYQWQQKMYDGSIQTFEMLKRPNTIEVIATQGDKILMARQSQPNKPEFYSLFGGRAEENEDPLVTAKRELLEEAGLESTDWQLIKSYQPFHKIDWDIYLYVARNCKKVTEPKLDAGEKIITKSYSFDEFLTVVNHEEFWGNQLALDILRMKQEGKLEQFRKSLFVS